MVVGASLIPTVEALWQEALQCSGLDPSDIENAPLHTNMPDMDDGRRLDFARIERAFRCLYAGLELVLPVQFEIRFRLLLARILQTYTKNDIEACEHLRKALVLVQSRADCPLALRLLTISSWCSNEIASSDKKQVKLINEARRDAIDGNLIGWWMHFDWLAWQKNQQHLLRDSLTLLDKKIPEGVERLSCQLYLIFLLSYLEPTLIASNLEPLVLAANGDEFLDATPLLVAANACIQERIEQGDMQQARVIFDKCSDLVPKCKGCLPGKLEISVERLQSTWAKTMALMSLRTGEAPNETIKTLQPDVLRAFLELAAPPMPEIPNGPYAKTYQTLTDLLRQAETHPTETFAECQALGEQDCPNLESLRMLIVAISQYHLKHPAHQVKASLLICLKGLNSRTQNAQMKIIVLLLLGQLYLDTDFAMSIKMNSAAYKFACTAEWHLLAHLAAQNLSRGLRLLGKSDEAAEVETAAADHLTKQPPLQP